MLSREAVMTLTAYSMRMTSIPFTEIKLYERTCDLQRGERISNKHITYHSKVQFRLPHEVNLVSNVNLRLSNQKMTLLVDTNIKHASTPYKMGFSRGCGSLGSRDDTGHETTLKNTFSFD